MMRSYLTRKYTSGLYNQKWNFLTKKTEQLSIKWKEMNDELDKILPIIRKPEKYTNPQYRQAIRHFPMIINKRDNIRREIDIWTRQQQLLKERSKNF